MTLMRRREGAMVPEPGATLEREKASRNLASLILEREA